MSSEDNTPSLIRYYKFLPVFISDKYKIIKASFFNEHSKFFYYLILKDNKYYVGVFDYIYSLIIFHSELISNEYMNVFSITNSYHLLLSNYTIFCPFVTGTNYTECNSGMKEIPILNIYSQYCKEASKKSDSPALSTYCKEEPISKTCLRVNGDNSNSLINSYSSECSGGVNDEFITSEIDCPYNYILDNKTNYCTICSLDSYYYYNINTNTAWC